eukprot:2514911-Pleurochrysis_carterae.AAC.1
MSCEMLCHLVVVVSASLGVGGGPPAARQRLRRREGALTDAVFERDAGGGTRRCRVRVRLFRWVRIAWFQVRARACCARPSGTACPPTRGTTPLASAAALPRPPSPPTPLAPLAPPLCCPSPPPPPPPPRPPPLLELPPLCALASPLPAAAPCEPAPPREACARLLAGAFAASSLLLAPTATAAVAAVATATATVSSAARSSASRLPTGSELVLGSFWRDEAASSTAPPSVSSERA